MIVNTSTSLNVLFGEGRTVEQGIERCSKAGFNSLDFNYWDFQEYVLGLSWEEEEAWAQQIQSAAEQNNIRFTQMHGPVHGRNYTDLVLDLNIESYFKLAERSIRFAAILNIPWVVFHATKTTPGNESTKKSLNYNVEFYKQLLPVMEETGVGIALENLVDPQQSRDGESSRNYSSETYELIELIDTLDHPLVGACWDTGHANLQGLDQGAALKDLGKHLKALHINDNNGKKDEHLLPYQGTVDWEAVTNALSMIGYEGDFTYEAHRSIQRLPEDLRDVGLKYAADLARFLAEKSVMKEGTQV